MNVEGRKLREERINIELVQNYRPLHYRRRFISILLIKRGEAARYRGTIRSLDW
jgi:hypothetical protein